MSSLAATSQKMNAFSPSHTILQSVPMVTPRPAVLGVPVPEWRVFYKRRCDPGTPISRLAVCLE